MKTYLVDLRFVRKFNEQGTFPVCADDEDDAKKRIGELFGKQDELEILRVTEVDKVPALAGMVAEYLAALEEDTEDEDKGPSIN